MSPKPKMLIVEDEESIRTGLTDLFTYNGFDVDGDADGNKALEKALTGSYQIILLDVMLPGIDGFEICNRIRSKDRRVPIIMLTARTSDEDIVKGLSLGADDYVSKPFSIGELKARVEAVLRRSERFRREVVSFRLGDLDVDPTTLLGHRKGKEILFTRREMEILLYLKDAAPRAVPRVELLEEVWGYRNADQMETRTIDIHIAKLRKKVEVDALQPRLLLTVRGEGYRLALAE